MNMNTKLKIWAIGALVFFVTLDLYLLYRTVDPGPTPSPDKFDPPGWFYIVGIIGLLVSGFAVCVGVWLRCPNCAKWWAARVISDWPTSEEIKGEKVLRGATYNSDGTWGSTVIRTGETIVIGHMRKRIYSCKYCAYEWERTYDPRTPPTF